MLPHVPKLILTGGWLAPTVPNTLRGFVEMIDTEPLCYKALVNSFAEMQKEMFVPYIQLITGPSTAREVDAILSERLHGLSPVRHVQAEVGVLPRSFPPHGPKDGVYRVSGFLSEETGPK